MGDVVQLDAPRDGYRVTVTPAEVADAVEGIAVAVQWGAEHPDRLPGWVVDGLRRARETVSRIETDMVWQTPIGPTGSVSRGRMGDA